MLKIKKPILGFEKYLEGELIQIDDIFAILKIANFTFTLINPFVLRKDYSFEIPNDVKILLEIDENNPPLVFCNVVRKEPFTESIINFKAPILINPKNKTLAQVVTQEWDFEELKNYIK